MRAIRLIAANIAAAAVVAAALFSPFAHADDWRPGYEVNTGCAGVSVSSGAASPAQSDGNGHCVTDRYWHQPTYGFYGEFYTFYATPTDAVCLQNPGTKVVRVFDFGLVPYSSGGGLVYFYWVKRSSLDTGGTPTTLTPWQADSADPAPGATLVTYTAAPTLGTAAGTIFPWEFNGTPSGGVGGLQSFHNYQYSTYGPTTPITLRHNEALCIDFEGNALPSGYQTGIWAQWTEWNW